MKYTVLRLTLLCALCASVVHPFAADAPRVFRAGAATSNITPKLGTSINGNMSDGKATHVHDELHSRAIVLDDGTTKLAIVVNDSCLVPREVFDEAKRLASEATGIPASHMLMSATHTHSAASSASVFQSEADMEYRAFFAVRIADAIRRANNNLAPARIGWGKGSVLGQVHNRRWHMQPGTVLKNPFGTEDQVKMNPGMKNPALLKPAGPTDPEVWFVTLQRTNGQHIALLADYSLHYVGGNPGISADYYGAFADRIQELLQADRQDPPFVGLMANGTSGDINNIPWRDGDTNKYAPGQKIKIVANAVATEVARALPGVKLHDWVPLAAAQKEISLGVRKPDPAALDRAKDILAKAPNQFPRLKGLDEIYARETVQMADYPDRVQLILQALRIGDLAITAAPCEIFVEIGLELKAQNPFPASFTISLANGYNGYLPTPAQHALGGYETWRAKSSYLEVNASPQITAGLRELLGQLKK
ncbi:MAG: hypothetical protein EBS05_22730 [Proteobacteria bacterium]|nr:hypothetical protein [Pseudomonadota bacterium]